MCRILVFLIYPEGYGLLGRSFVGFGLMYMHKNVECIGMKKANCKNTWMLMPFFKITIWLCKIRWPKWIIYKNHHMNRLLLIILAGKCNKFWRIENGLCFYALVVQAYASKYFTFDNVFSVFCIVSANCSVFLRMRNSQFTPKYLYS